MSTLPLFDWEPAPLPDLVPEPAPARQWNRIAAPAGPPELWVIDAKALLVRAYHDMHPRSSPTGAPVGAVLGLSQLLMQAVRRGAARHVALVYDAGRTTFHNRIDPRYKAHRGEPPDDLAAQLEPALRLGQALGFAAYSVPDYEADDLTATLARPTRRPPTPNRCTTTPDATRRRDLAGDPRQRGPITMQERRDVDDGQAHGHPGSFVIARRSTARSPRPDSTHDARARCDARSLSSTGAAR